MTQSRVCSDELMKVKVQCPGKVILFGEHASVYGYPSLVTTVSIYTEVEVERLIDPVIIYEVPSFDFKSECKVSIFDDITQITNDETEANACQEIKQILTQKQSLAENSWYLLVYMYHKIVPSSGRFGIRVTATTDLWTGAGLGSSASYCCSVALALLTLCKGDVSIENVNNIAYHGEKIFHGRPSGVDNTACSHGGCLMYVNKSGHKTFKPVSLKKTPKIMIIDSKQAHSTAKIVAEVAKKSENLQTTFERIGEISLDGEKCLTEGRDIGDLMVENHNLLNKLPAVANSHTDKIVQICNDYGVPAKITGAGGGGVVIGLLREEVDVVGLRETLERCNYEVMVDVKTGVDGVRVIQACS